MGIDVPGFLAELVMAKDATEVVNVLVNYTLIAFYYCNYTSLIGLELYIRVSQLALLAYNKLSHKSTLENVLSV